MPSPEFEPESFCPATQYASMLNDSFESELRRTKDQTIEDERVELERIDPTSCCEDGWIKRWSQDFNEQKVHWVPQRIIGEGSETWGMWNVLSPANCLALSEVLAGQ